MAKKISLLFPLVFAVATGFTQQKVASYSFGKFGTDDYEHLAFWVKDGKRTTIDYSYGKGPKEVKLAYVRKDVFKGASCFVVQFTNGHTLFVIPDKLQLRVTDSAGKYNKVFSWEYEGPVNGIGTFCEPCAEDETAAMKILQSSYLK